jgi:hypothetical protein
MAAAVVAPATTEKPAVTPAAVPAANSQQPSAPAAPSALYLVGARLREYATHTFEAVSDLLLEVSLRVLHAGRAADSNVWIGLQRKPWSEVLDRTSFNKPSSVQEAANRLRKNAGYFKINYLIVILLTVAGTFLTHPSSLFVLAFLLASWVYLFAIRQGPLVINGKELRSAALLLQAAHLLMQRSSNAAIVNAHSMYTISIYGAQQLLLIRIVCQHTEKLSHAACQ